MNEQIQTESINFLSKAVDNVLGSVNLLSTRVKLLEEASIIREFEEKYGKEEDECIELDRISDDGELIEFCNPDLWNMTDEELYEKVVTPEVLTEQIHSYMKNLIDNHKKEKEIHKLYFTKISQCKPSKYEFHPTVVFTFWYKVGKNVVMVDIMAIVRASFASGPIITVQTVKFSTYDTYESRVNTYSYMDFYTDLEIRSVIGEIIKDLNTSKRGIANFVYDWNKVVDELAP